MKLEEFLSEDLLIGFHQAHLSLINKSAGSKSKHQAWVGGYRDHIEQCLNIALYLFNMTSYPFSFKSVVRVLYFHDMEKIWAYSLNIKIDKE
ncbi:hypothetical protein LBMAG51_10930 [Phycisphaerae bacterium]|nr:hypothetical protein LBMAG51_10930 [Phycisphaerae bacterium]